MRAIGGDALRDRLQNLGYDDWNQGATTTWAEAFNECADMVDEQPTIEPQRKKGKWLYGESEAGNDGYYCSKCGNFVPWKYDEYDIDFIKEFLFCNKCGADMREPEDIPMEYFESGGR